MNVVSSATYAGLLLAILVFTVWLAFQLQTKLINNKILDQDQASFLRIHKSIGNVMIILMSCLIVNIMWLLVIAIA